MINIILIFIAFYRDSKLCDFYIPDNSKYSLNYIKWHNDILIHTIYFFVLVEDLDEDLDEEFDEQNKGNRFI